MAQPLAGRIIVFGSLNIDIVQRVSRLPVTGETVAGADLAIFTGGKGANQSCAAARLGARASMAGVVGNDAFAQAILEDLCSAGVDTSLVRRSPRMSGTAMIFLTPNGDNAIVLSPGANMDANSELAEAAIASIGPGDILLCQLEVPVAAVARAVSLAHDRDAITILDPAPAFELPDGLLHCVDILTPNQSEAATLLGWSTPVATVDEARHAAVALRARGPASVIVKLGALGCLVDTAQMSCHVPAIAGDVVDTTAAGDTFNGALAVALQEGLELLGAARFAVVAGSLAIRRAGALASIPSRAEVDALLPV
jgi:ribokinase